MSNETRGFETRVFFTRNRGRRWTEIDSLGYAISPKFGSETLDYGTFRDVVRDHATK